MSAGWEPPPVQLVQLGELYFVTDGHHRVWWAEEVEPLVARLRETGVGTDLRDVQLYVTALAVRDRLGHVSWPGDIAERFPTGPLQAPRTSRWVGGRGAASYTPLAELVTRCRKLFRGRSRLRAMLQFRLDPPSVTRRSIARDAGTPHG